MIYFHDNPDVSEETGGATPGLEERPQTSLDTTFGRSPPAADGEGGGGAWPAGVPDGIPGVGWFHMAEASPSGYVKIAIEHGPFRSFS